MPPFPEVCLLKNVFVNIGTFMNQHWHLLLPSSIFPGQSGAHAQTSVYGSSHHAETEQSQVEHGDLEWEHFTKLVPQHRICSSKTLKKCVPYLRQTVWFLFSVYVGGVQSYAQNSAAGILKIVPQKKNHCKDTELNSSTCFSSKNKQTNMYIYCKPMPDGTFLITA